jgi:hypothetical protein
MIAKNGQQVDAQNPAMALQFHSGVDWRGVCDPDR